MSVRARRHDFAVLRVLGLDRRQLRAVVHWQATTMAVIGLAIGIPAGILLGRRVFEVIADRAGVVSVANIPVTLLRGR